MPIVAEYCALSVPRFAALNSNGKLIDALLAQRALWSVLCYQLVVKHGVTVELRFGSTGEDAPAYIALRVHGTKTPALFVDLRQAETLLPADYQWHKSGTPTQTIEKARIARVVRRLEYVDLPSTSPLIARAGALAPMLSIAKGSAGNQIPSSARKPAPLGFKLADGEPLRELPLPETTDGELATRRFCLPMPGPISEWKASLKTLFQAIQRVGKATISFCIHPVDEKVRTDCQLVAMIWQRFLDAFMPDMAHSGFTDTDTLRSAFSRFGLPGNNLFVVSIRIAALTDQAAVSVANIVAEALGGARGFRVLPPRRDADEGALVLADLDLPGPAWSAEKSKSFRVALVAELIAQGIGEINETEILDFLLRMPHMFSLQEVEQIFKLPIAEEEGLPGLKSHVIAPFSVPSISFSRVVDADGRIQPAPLHCIRIGMLDRAVPKSDADPSERFSSYAWHTLNLADLTKHALIVGSTGSGKTMTTLFLVRELCRNKIPVMVVEPVKTEYFEALRDLIPGITRLRLEGDASGLPGAGYLAFDPLRVPRGTTVARHTSYIKSCFEGAFSLNEFLALLLENGLRSYYEDAPANGGCGFNKFTRGEPSLGRVEQGKVFPSFATFRLYFDRFLDVDLQSMASKGSSDLQQIKDAFKRRFANLGDGVVGECFAQADLIYVRSNRHQAAYDIFPSYLNSPVIVELDAVPDADQKALVMAFLLSRLFEQRQAEDFLAREMGRRLKSGLRHFLIIEEAHRLLSTQASASTRGGETVGDSSKAKSVQLFVDMLAEIRAFGQGLGIVEQIPTKIVGEAVKNTNLKIMLRLTAKDDREYLGQSMNFTDEQMAFVTNLRVEQGRQINFVVFEEGIEQPLLLSLPLPSGSNAKDPYQEFFVRKEK